MAGVSKAFIEAAKKATLNFIDDGELKAHYKYGGNGSVSACVYAYQPASARTRKFLPMRSQICHAEVPDMCTHKNPQGGAKFLIDYIMQSTKEVTDAQKKAKVRFLQAVMNHHVLSKSFLEHDAQKAVDEHMMVRDVASLPSNVCMMAMILTRALWEQYQVEMPYRFVDLVDAGLSEAEGIVYSNFIKTDTMKFSPITDCGHCAFPTNLMTREGVNNFIEGKLGIVSKGSLVEGYGTHTKWQEQGPRYSAYSSFDDSVELYGRGSRPTTMYSIMCTFLKEKKTMDDVVKFIKSLGDKT